MIFSKKKLNLTLQFYFKKFIMQQQQSLFNQQKTDVRHLVTKSQLIEIMLKDGLSSGQIRDYFINIR